MVGKYERYSMVLQWSNIDNVYLVTVPELLGLITHEDTYEEAIKNGLEVIELWIDADQESGRPIASPRVLLGGRR